jgi:LysR family transcriptional regulator, regulator for metE and metH
MDPAHPLNARTFIRAENFAGEHLIIYSTPEENRAFQQVIAPAGVSPAKISSIQLTEAIVEMVKAGMGLGILSRWSVAHQIEAGAIRALPLTKRGLFRCWSAATQNEKQIHPTCRPSYGCWGTIQYWSWTPGP